MYFCALNNVKGMTIIVDFKVIALGNILMGDDGIGVRVAKNIKQKLESEGIRVIIGETDFEYCLSEIEDGDMLIILDAACLGGEPGNITALNLMEHGILKNACSQHDLNLMYMLSLYKKSIRGYVLGIEVDTLEFDLNLSTVLEKKMPIICKETLSIIYRLKTNISKC